MFRTLTCAAAIAVTLLPAGVIAQSDPGAYLAGRQAGIDNDFAMAARYFTQSMMSDPANPALMERAMTAYVLLGQVDRARPIADRMVAEGFDSQLAYLIRVATAAEAGNWSNIEGDLDGPLAVSPLADGLFRAWAALGQGTVDDALSRFDAVIDGEGMRTYGIYHKALALASVGDYESALETIELINVDGRAYSKRSAVAHAQILSQLGRNEAAEARLLTVFGNTLDPSIVQMRADLAAGQTLSFDIAPTPRAGVAEVAHMIAQLIDGETPDPLTLQYVRIAQHLAPTDTDTIMFAGDLLQDLDRHLLASETFAKVSPSDPAFANAELGRIDALRRVDRSDAAVEVARALTRSHSDLPFVHAKLGDVLRANRDFTGAFEAYSTALSLYPDDDPNRWLVLYTRAISAHAEDNWPQAETDFRAALALNPDQPQVLNYLGYSLVERNEKLDEALTMIETAVAAQPDNGAIVDSLGWVLFQLGDYEDSVFHMERAASLEATDPIINDHLGDAYWAVGRKIEAAFQWQRALSFDPGDELADRIRLKLEIGLDAVLEAEGGKLIHLANDEG